MSFTDFLTILKDYYQLILSALSLVCAIVLFLIKKRPDANLFKSIIVDLLEYIPEAIRTAEKTGKTGAEKKALVMTCIDRYIDVRVTGMSYEDKVELLNDMSDFVESVLSTPERKFYEKKNVK